MYLTCFDIFVLYCFYCVLSCDSDKLLFDDQLCELYFFLPKVIHSLVFNLFFLEYLDPWAEWECERNDSSPLPPLPPRVNLALGLVLPVLRMLVICLNEVLLTEGFTFKALNIS